MASPATTFVAQRSEKSRSRSAGGSRSRIPRATNGRVRLRPVTDSGHGTQDKLERLGKLRDEALHAGTGRAVEKHRSQGKLLARERLLRLLDPGSFVEVDRYVRHREPNFGMLERRPWGDAVVTGYGTIFGRKVFVFSQDFTVFGGASPRSSPRRSAR